MQSFRCYCLDETDHINRVTVFECEQRDLPDKAREELTRGKWAAVEVWNRGQRVCRLNGPMAEADSRHQATH